MRGYWLSLPAHWKLEDVQAALNVIITVLSALGIFVFVRYRWQQGAKRVARDKDVSLPFLLSLNTLGEALDVLFLLKEKLLSLRYLSILAQCIVVICLSSTAILCGPITRYSTRRGHFVSLQEVPGLLPTRQHNGVSLANIQWNLTYTRLEKAGFPKDQLLDYLPDNSIDWIFKASEWNNSWSLDCHGVPQTPIKLHDSGNCTRLRYEIPELDQAFSFSNWDKASYASGGFYSQPHMNKDILLFLYGWKKWDYEPSSNTNRSMSISLLSLHMHQVPRNENTTSACEFRQGEIGESSYTKTECELRRREHVEDPLNAAFPDNYSPDSVPAAYQAYYQARFTQASTTDNAIPVITPDELIRFYQAYMIVKDVQYRQPVTRRLSVDLVVVQLSTVFLVVAILLALLILLGLGHYVWFVVYHHNIFTSTPQSKLDWMMQSIQAEDQPPSDDVGRVRRSVTVDSSRGLSGMSSVGRKRIEFESAKYGRRETSVWFLRDSMISTYGQSSRMKH